MLPHALVLTKHFSFPSPYRDISTRVRSASGVIVVGGGPAGFELVGEIAAAYPDKKITLISDQGKWVDVCFLSGIHA